MILLMQWTFNWKYIFNGSIPLDLTSAIPFSVPRRVLLFVVLEVLGQKKKKKPLENILVLGLSIKDAYYWKSVQFQNRVGGSISSYQSSDLGFFETRTCEPMRRRTVSIFGMTMVECRGQEYQQPATNRLVFESERALNNTILYGCYSWRSNFPAYQHLWVLNPYPSISILLLKLNYTPLIFHHHPKGQGKTTKNKQSYYVLLRNQEFPFSELTDCGIN